MSAQPADEEFQEGEVPDDEPEPARFPKAEPLQPPPDPEPSSNQIVFQTVTDHSLHLEKKKKKIHKQQKDKRTPSATREKDKNREKDLKDRSVKTTRILEKQTLPQAPSPYPHPIYQAPYYPPQAHYYPPLVYPHPAVLPPAMPPSYSYPPQHYYSPVGRGAYGMVPLPPQPLRTQIPIMGQPMGNIQPIPMINQQTKVMQGRAPPGTFFREIRSANEVPEKHEEVQNVKNTVATQQQQKTSLRGSMDCPEKIKQDVKRRGSKEELKGIIRKQLKGLSAQEQLNLLEMIRCLLKYHEKLDLAASKAQSSDRSLAKTAYQRSLDMLQSLSDQSDERKHTLNKLLETLGLDSVVCTLNERKLFESAKANEQFRKIGEKGKYLLRDPFQTLLN